MPRVLRNNGHDRRGGAQQRHGVRSSDLAAVRARREVKRNSRVDAVELIVSLLLLAATAVILLL